MYRNLEAELKRKGLLREDIAKLLGCTITTASEKLTKPERLKLEEAQKIKLAFFPSLTLDYLFEITKESA